MAHTIKTARIATGRAQSEGRQPSHDGEYITTYYTADDPEIIAEHNAGTFCLDDLRGTGDGLNTAEENTAVVERAHQIRQDDSGEKLAVCGGAARDEMIQLGWATREQFDGNHYLQGLREA